MYELIKKLKEVNPKLNEFLVKRRLRTKFLTNYQNDGDNSPFTIRTGFLWSGTSEGWKFWEKLNAEFNALKYE